MRHAVVIGFPDGSDCEWETILRMSYVGIGLLELFDYRLVLFDEAILTSRYTRVTFDRNAT